MLVKRGKYFHTKFGHEGLTYWRSLKTGDRNEATKREAVLRSELLKGEFGILSTKTTPCMLDFTPRLKEHWALNVTPNTAAFYSDNLKVLNAFGQLSLIKLNKIDEAIIEKFTQHRKADGVTIKTVNHALRTLRRALMLAVEWKVIGRMPKVRMLKGENERSYVISDETIEAMTTWSRENYPVGVFHLLLPFLCDSGLRISEALALKREHVEFSEDGTVPRFIRVTKGKTKYSVRSIPLSDRAAFNLLAAMGKSKCDYCFAIGSKRIHRANPSRHFLEARNALGIGPEAVLHSTRHTFASRLGNNGADAYTIQALCGHGSILISQKYVHSDLPAKQLAISIIDRLNQKPLVTA
jgi:site-specific recombinase XerD